MQPKVILEFIYPDDEDSTFICGQRAGNVQGFNEYQDGCDG
jgi:hypothetical protein